MPDLFSQKLAQELKTQGPLADRLRPLNFAQYFGQEHLVGQGKILRQIIENDQIPSLIFWGPPGSGKTSLARLIAQMTKADFVEFSAAQASVADIRAAAKEAQDKLKFNGQRTILFLDEIHRFNKAQQDAFLPLVERGIITLIGATTENPSFEVNSALLSRCRVFVFNQLSKDSLIEIINHALVDQESGLGKLKIVISQEVVEYLAQIANGDARSALNALEMAVKTTPVKAKKISITQEKIKEALQKSSYLYDRAGEQHYNIISALHKSLRGSDVDAALYWLARMLEAGEDPLYVARRLVRFAAEDVGMADPRAIVQAVAAYQACQFIGMPECNVILAELVVYLAKAPKSIAVYQAYLQVQKDVQETMDEPVPLHLRNAPTKLMKNLGYGKDYKYTPLEDDSNQEYLPEKLKGRKYWIK